MSKITNDGLTRSGTGCFIAVPIWQTVGFEGLTCRRQLVTFDRDIRLGATIQQNDQIYRTAILTSPPPNQGDTDASTRTRLHE